MLVVQQKFQQHIVEKDNAALDYSGLSRINAVRCINLLLQHPLKLVHVDGVTQLVVHCLFWDLDPYFTMHNWPFIWPL